MTNNLHITQPALEKVAGYTLSPDRDLWESEITKHIYESFPFLTKYQLSIILDKVDDKAGYGYGNIIVNNEVTIPLIIRNFELMPLDIMVLGEDEFHPLTENRLDEVLFNPGLFDQAVTPEDTSGGYAENYPPHSGKYVYASVGCGILERIKNTISDTDKDYFLNKLASNDDIRAVYQTKGEGHLDLIRKIAAYGRNNKDRTPLYRTLYPSVIQLEKVGYDRFLVRAVSDQLYAPVEKEMDGEELLGKFGEDVHTSVLDNDEHMIIVGKRPQCPIMLDGMRSELKKLTDYGYYEVRTNLNDKVRGWLFPKVIDFDGVQLGKDKLFTDGCQLHSLQQDIVGEAIDSTIDACCNEDPPHGKLCQGKTGVFAMTDGKTGVCTVPITIMSPVFDMGDFVRVEVNTSLGQTLVLEICDGVNAISPSRRDKYVRIIPASMKFIEVGKPQRLQDDTDAVVKFAQSALQGSGYIELSCPDGDRFSFAGPHLAELTGGNSEVPRNRAKFHLVALGMRPADAMMALDRAAKNGKTTITNFKPLLTVHEKRAQVTEEVVLPLMQSLPRMKTDLIKEAAFFDDLDTVDSVLSLNFINPENVQTFIESIPDLKEAASKVAQLLLASRLGMGAIPEPAAKKVLDNLEEVIENLESLQASPQMIR